MFRCMILILRNSKSTRVSSILCSNSDKYNAHRMILLLGVILFSQYFHTKTQRSKLMLGDLAIRDNLVGLELEGEVALLLIFCTQW